MKTHGHHAVARLAGEPLLRDTFRKAFGEDVALDSFYLGNYLTDVAQAYDPVAGATVDGKIDGFVDDAFEVVEDALTVGRVVAELVGFFTGLDPQMLTKLQREKRKEVKDALHWLLHSFIEPYEGGAPLYFRVTQNAFFFKAYLDFVHPNIPPETSASLELRMDMGVFIDVFDRFFTQYWPHDHMDRPALSPEPPPQPPVVPFDSRRPDPAAGTGIEPSGIYSYLLEFARLTGADLADLDMNWARPYLSNPPAANTLATDRKFQFGLANLGRALHGVEDYFAHSNYIEHAAKVMGAAYQPHIYQFDNARYLKRLKRLMPKGAFPDWHDGPEEPHIVTGYFDFRDTAVSLMHLLEGPLMGVINRQPKDVTLELREHFDVLGDPDYADAYYARQADKLAADLMEVIQDPKTAWGKPDNAGTWSVKAVLKSVSLDKFIEDVGTLKGHLNSETPASEESIRYFRALLKEAPVFREIEAMATRPDPHKELDYDQLIRLYSAFVLYIRYLLAKRAWGNVQKSFLEVVEALLWWYFLPHKGAKKWLKRVVSDEIADRLTFVGKEKIYDVIAADRIGCHSLMSKDHGPEWLYGPMRNCAIAAHHYIVKNMLRWHDYRSTTVPANRKFIDWDDVVRHVMTHPATGVVYTIDHPVPTSLFHTLTEADMKRPWRDVLKEIANQYMPLTLETARADFDENRIIWGNFPSMFRNMNPEAVHELYYATVVNPTLGSLFLARRIVIPYIRYKLGVADPTQVNPRWYMPLMSKDWKPQQLATFNMRHELVYHPAEDLALDRARSAASVRKWLEDKYQPPKHPPG